MVLAVRWNWGFNVYLLVSGCNANADVNNIVMYLWCSTIWCKIFGWSIIIHWLKINLDWSKVIQCSAMYIWYDMIWIFWHWIVFNSMQSIWIQKQPKMIKYADDMIQFGCLKLVLDLEAPTLISTTHADMIHTQRKICSALYPYRNDPQKGQHN